MSDDRIAVGERLGGRYLITRLLGEGGMGAVYLAVDEVLGVEVALKMVRRDLAGGSAGIARLRDEVLLAQKVTHPNVCRTYDLEEVEGAFLVKMEFCAGETLAARLEREKLLSVDDALGIARQVLAGLDAAHAKGVVHCDLKPQNILLEDATGRVVLMDFGIARATAREPGAEGQGASSGTPEYMAPEQVRNLGVDGRADLYALGCMLHQLLLGETPFPARTRLACMLRHVTDEPIDPRTRRADLPAWLASAILRLLAKDPERRFPDAQSALAALGGPRRRDWRRIGAVAAVAVAVFAGALVGVYRVAHRREWRPEIRERLPSYEENADMPVISPDGKWLAYVSDRDGSWRVYLEPMAGGSGRPITARGQKALVPRFTHDSAAVLFADGEGHVLRAPLDGSPPAPVAGDAYFADDCGGRLVLMHPSSTGCPSCQRLSVTEPGGAERDLVRLPSGSVLSMMRCDRAGTRVAYAAATHGLSQQSPSDVWVVALDGSAPRALTDDHLQNDYPTFASDGRSVIFSSARSGNLNLWEVPVGGGAPIALTTGEGPDLASEAAPDGNTLLFDNDITSVPLYAQSLEIGVARRKITRTLEDVSLPIAVPDGSEVIAEVRRHGRSYIIGYPLGDGEERVIAEGDLPALSLDGGELFYRVAPAGGAARIVAMPRLGLAAGARARVVAEGADAVAAVTPGPDRQLHLRVVAAQGLRAMRVAMDGGAIVEEAPAPWNQVIPAPTGQWRIATLLAGVRGFRSHVIPPGAPLDDAAARVVDAQRLAWDADGRSFLYWNGSEIRRHVVATGDDRHLIVAHDVDGLGVAADGKTLFYSETLGHVRRQLIVNFADRVRPGL